MWGTSHWSATKFFKKINFSLPTALPLGWGCTKNKNSMQSNKLKCSKPFSHKPTASGRAPYRTGWVFCLHWVSASCPLHGGVSSGTFLHCVLLSSKRILNTLCNLWGYLRRPHFVLPEYDRLPVDCLLCKITHMEQNVSCSWSITLPWYSLARVWNNHKKQSCFFFKINSIKKNHLFKLFQQDVELQSDHR